MFNPYRLIRLSAFYSIITIMLTACGGGGNDGNAGGGVPGTGAVLQSITVTPARPVLKVGTTQQMIATGNYDDGGQSDLSSSVTWAAVGGGITMSPSGLITAVSPGSDIATAINTNPAVQGLTTVYTSTYGVEGTLTSPVAVTLETPYAGEVNFGGPGNGNGYSYYAVNVTPGAAYYVFLTGLDGVPS